ncbi:type 1 fimbrial protein [Pseudomonas sp. CCM 7891]|uniref:Type 1 fimbrial protein n=1 Tax=Pseudomonas karstica TaxID=1055468 RepID=A0A7X2UXP5_9PSED|nr:fimbrial protein [Pseudomonas karstica]MTD18252.1 type 1 fimbrial protein [Pseudomonas karstica]
MKKQILAMALLATYSLVTSSAIAANGTINISGLISGTTCTISGGTGGNPGSGANFPVVLDRVQTSALGENGATAASKPFFIYVGGTGTTCPNGTKVAVLYEASSPAINPATGNLRNTATATPADKVEVQIVDAAANTPMDLRSGQNSTIATVTGGLATLPFAARYIATGGAATAGIVSTSVQYSVTFP